MGSTPAWGAFLFKGLLTKKTPPHRFSVKFTYPMKKILSALTKPRLFSRIWNKILSIFYFKQWALLVKIGSPTIPPTWSGFKVLLPPKDSFWADPFPWEHQGKYYIFYEALPFATNRGHIACIELDKDLNIINNQIVLQRPYHLSYPFIFEHENQIYMLPETGENKTIELYRCTNFPNQWEFEKVLIPNITAFDATLFQAHNKWWMFANIMQTPDGNSHDTLALFYADSPLSENWTPHPKNPIVSDIKTARPAGKVASQGGALIRPSQDCSVRYGYAINFNTITTLTETDYAETCKARFTPPLTNLKTLATHTSNTIENIHTIDAQFWRRKI